MNSRPKISFLCPYRWLVEPDVQFLGDNLKRNIIRCVGDQEEIKQLRLVVNYAIRFEYRAYKPVDIELTNKQLQKLLKPLFPNGKCLDVDTDFIQVRSRTVLPVIDFQIYY